MINCKIYFCIFLFFLIFIIFIISNLIKSKMFSDDKKHINKFYTNNYFIYFINCFIITLVVYLSYNYINNPLYCDCQCLVKNTIILKEKFD